MQAKLSDTVKTRLASHIIDNTCPKMAKAHDKHQTQQTDPFQNSTLSSANGKKAGKICTYAYLELLLDWLSERGTATSCIALSA